MIMRLKNDRLRTLASSLFAKSALALLLAGFGFSAPAAAKDLPAFQELYQLLRANLPELTEEELDRAAAQGLLAQFPSKVLLVPRLDEAATTAEATAPLSKATIFDNAFAYLRIGQIAPGLPEQLRAAYESLQSTNSLKGVVVDLRFAGGNDYAAAAGAADQFLSTERPLLNWGDGMVHSAAKTNAILLPVAVLVNQETTGAAEALAAVLREAHVALVIGSKTAGAAYRYHEHTLKDGQRLRLAAELVKLGNGNPISSEGVKPDIQVKTTLESERAYLEDAYLVLPRAGENAALNSSEAGPTMTNHPPRRRINEAELVRMQREGLDPDYDPTAGEISSPLPPQINDPALNRALDLLKGLAVVRQVRRS
jgi:hypothetical protein